MSADDSDKTVFKPAVGGNPELTTFRPMPGGGVPRPGVQNNPAGSPPPSRPAPADVRNEAFNVSMGLNPLVNAASSLIGVFEKTRASMTHSNIGGLHQRLQNEIRTFESALRDQGVAPEIILSARYVMCSVLDETVLNTPWGSDSAWAQRTLLSVFHNETSGGEKFFLILDRMRQAPSENLNMIELMYVCLSLGFEGKYRLMARGRDAIEQIRDELYTTIRRYRGESDRNLADSWKGLGRTRNTLAQYVPMWVIVVGVIALLFFSFSGFKWWLFKTSTPVAVELQEINSAVLEAQAEKSDNKLIPSE